MKKYLNRSQVPTEQKWDLSFLLDKHTLEELIGKVINLKKELITLKESRYQQKEIFIKALKLEDQITILNNKIFNYLSNWINEDVTNNKPNELKKDFEYQKYELDLILGPEISQVFKHEKIIRKFLEDEKLVDYRSYYHRIFRTKKHQLTNTIQTFKNTAAYGKINTYEPFSILTDGELIFPPILDKNGKEHVFNHARRSELEVVKDKVLRQNAYYSFRQGYLNVKQTLANFLYQHFKAITVEGKLHNFPSTIEYLLFEEQIPEKLLLTLYQATKNNIKLRKKAINFTQKIYQLKYGIKMHVSDEEMPLVSTKAYYSLAEQKDLVLAALKPMGPEYLKMVEKAFSENWIDFASYPKKMSGGYSMSFSYGIEKKLILLNNSNDFLSLITLVHEIGHSIHTYYSDKTQHIRDSEYQMFIAEIASIFNELMLFDHLLKTSNNLLLKFNILHNIIKMFNLTVFQQVQWSNYEYNLLKAIEKGKPLSTYEALKKLYDKNHQFYSNLKSDSFNAIRVPHFYGDFYVYKYAIGQICACIFFARYQKEGKKVLEDYLQNFLAMGKKYDPLEILKQNNIDLSNPQTYQIAFDFFEDILNKWKKLAKQIYPDL